MAAVLLLNASYEPLKIISWQRAISLFFSDKVEVVDEYEHEIRSISLAIKAPSVVRLLKYISVGSKSPPMSRFNIFARDNFKCQYCSKKLTSGLATIDHVIPRSKGGKTDWSNVVCCCKPCNSKKGSKTPDTAGMRLLKKPVKPHWLPVIHVKLNGRVPNSWNTFLKSFARRE